MCGEEGVPRQWAASARPPLRWNAFTQAKVLAFQLPGPPKLQKYSPAQRLLDCEGKAMTATTEHYSIATRPPHQSNKQNVTCCYARPMGKLPTDQGKKA